MRVRVGGVLLSSAAVLPGMVDASSAGAQQLSTAPDCASSFQPYDYTAAALKACGIETSGLTAVAALAGGGSRYDYDLPSGAVLHLYLPPVGFDPLTASDAQLAEYMLPARPQGLEAFAAWNQAMSSAKFPTAALPYVIDSKVRHGIQYSGNWSGYQVDGSRNEFTTSQATFYQPSVYASACSSTSVAMWGGIGGITNSDTLGQDGTERDVSQPGSPNSPYSWQEVLGPSGDVMNVSDLAPFPSPGDYMSSYTTWQANPAQFTGYVEDVTTQQFGQPWSVSNLPSNAKDSGDSFEAITEAPTIGNTEANLSNFRTMYYYGGWGNGNGLNTYSPTGDANGHRFGDYMIDGSNQIMAQPGNLGIRLPNGLSNASDFAVSQMHCN
jgi:hypothetical protein